MKTDELRRLIHAALVADQALERLEEHDVPSRELSASDRHARNALLDALGALGSRPDRSPADVAVRLADGTLAVRVQSIDGLALIPPDRIYRV